MESTIMRQYVFVLGHPCDLISILLSDDPISSQPVLGCHNLLEGCGKLSHSRRIGALVISIGMVMSILYNHPAPGTSATTLCHILSGMPVDAGEAPLSSTLMVLLDPYQVLGCVVRVVCSCGMFLRWTLCYQSKRIKPELVMVSKHRWDIGGGQDHRNNLQS
jgi:hypothetical protein